MDLDPGFFEDSRLLGNSFTFPGPSQGGGTLDLNSRINSSGGVMNGKNQIIWKKLNFSENIPERDNLIEETENLLRAVIGSEKNYSSCWSNRTAGSSPLAGRQWGGMTIPTV